MAFEGRQYLIIQTSDLSNVDFTQVLETSADTVRRSVDETKTFVKWEGVMPQFLNDLTNTEGPYTHSEILEILSGEEWTAPIDESESGI